MPDLSQASEKRLSLPPTRQGPFDLPARSGHGLVHVVIDTPQGSTQKYKYDPRLGLFKLSRVLPRGMQFPYDFGSVPSTVAADGDALDVMVLADSPSFVGCLMSIRLIGVIEARQTEKGKTIRNDRLLGVAQTPVNNPPVTRLQDVEPETIEALEHFFVNYNRAHGREFKPLRRSGPQVAERLLKDAIRSHDKRGV
jgi:inorganic pyrophosphatase